MGLLLLVVVNWSFGVVRVRGRVISKRDGKDG